MERRLLSFTLVKWIAAALLSCFLVLIADVGGAAAEPSRVWLHGWDAHGRPFDLARMRGQIVALTFTSRFTGDEGSRVNDALASRATNGDAIVVSVVDLVGVPSFAFPYARRRVAEHDRAGCVQHLVDDRSELTRAFHVDPSRRVDILIIDRDGALRGRYSGEKQIDDALRLVDELRSHAHL